MLNLKGLVARIRRSQNEKGQGLVEYALILVLVAIVVIAVLLTLGPTVAGVYCQVANALQPGSCAAGPTATVTGPYTWGVNVFNSTTICSDLGLTSGTAYVWADNPSPVDTVTTFYLSDSGSSAPASGFVVVGSNSCSP